MKFKFKDKCEALCYSDDDFYAICNGYCRPEQILSDPEQVDAINDAVALLESFFDQARDAGKIEEM